MIQNYPNWATILLGSSGLFGLLTIAGGYAGFVIKKHIEALEKENQNLSNEKEQLQRNLEKAENDINNLNDRFIEMAKSLEDIQGSNSLNPESAARLQRIMADFQRIKSMQEEFNDYKIAAKWLKYRKDDWVQEAAKTAMEKYPKLISKVAKKEFKQDITNYLNWIYISLYVNGHPRRPITKDVINPAIKHDFPYIAAIRHIKDNRDRGELSPLQSKYLENMCDELINKIRKEFE